jgi:hypothetical protein
VLAHWNNSTHLDMSLYSDAISWFRTNKPLLLFLNAVRLREKYQIPIFFSLVRSERDPNQRSNALKTRTMYNTEVVLFIR